MAKRFDASIKWEHADLLTWIDARIPAGGGAVMIFPHEVDELGNLAGNLNKFRKAAEDAQLPPPVGDTPEARLRARLQVSQNCGWFNIQPDEHAWAVNNLPVNAPDPARVKRQVQFYNGEGGTRVQEWRDPTSPSGWSFQKPPTSPGGDPTGHHDVDGAADKYIDTLGLSVPKPITF